MTITTDEVEASPEFMTMLRQQMRSVLEAYGPMTGEEVQVACALCMALSAAEKVVVVAEEFVPDMAPYFAEIAEFVEGSFSAFKAIVNGTDGHREDDEFQA